MSIRRISSLGISRVRPVHTVYGAKPNRIEAATASGAITKPLNLEEMLASQPTDASRFHPCEECGKVTRGDSPLCEECSADREEVEGEAPGFAEKEAYARRVRLIRVGITATVTLAALATLFWFNDVRRLIDGLLPHRSDPLPTVVQRDVASAEGLAFPTLAQRVQTASVVATTRLLVATATVRLPDRIVSPATQAVSTRQTPTTAPRAGAIESARPTSPPASRSASALTPTLSPAHRTAGPASAQPQLASPTGITSPTPPAAIPSGVPATTSAFPTQTPIPTNAAGLTALPGLPTPTASRVASSTPTAHITSPTPRATAVGPTISPLPGRTILPEPSRTIPLPTPTVEVTVPPLPTLPAPTLTVAVPTSIPPLPTAPPVPTQPLPGETPPIPTVTVAVPTSIPPLPTAPPAPPTAPPMPTQPVPTQAPTQPVPTPEPTAVATSLVPTLPPAPTLTVLPDVTVTVPLP